MISGRAFATAVLVLLGLSWLVQQIDPVRIDYGTRLRWQEVEQINTCLVEGADLLEQRYTDYRNLVAQSQETNGRWRSFAGFGMGSGDVITPKGAQPSPCYRWFGGGEPGSLQYLAKNYLGHMTTCARTPRLPNDGLRLGHKTGLPSSPSDGPWRCICRTHATRRYLCAKPWSNRRY